MKQTLVLFAFISLLLSSCVKEEPPIGRPSDLREVVIIDHNITTDEVWKGDMIYHITSSIQISNTANLTIEPGCIVKFDYNTYIVIPDNSHSSINALGTSQNQIIFTSSGNRTDNDEWSGIIIAEEQFRSSFEHCIFEHCERAISFSGYSIDVNYCKFRQCKLNGILLDSKSEFGSFNNNEFEANVASPIKMDANAVNSIGKNNIFNEGSYIEVYNNLDNYGSHTWKNLNIPYRILDNYFTIFTYTNSVCELILEPGVEIEIPNGFTVGSYLGSGRLIARGTSSAPIVFSPRTFDNSSSPSYWSGITFSEYAIGSSILDHCIVSYGGERSSEGGNINIYNMPLGTLNISNCSIKDSYEYGIYKVPNAMSPVLNNNTFENNAGGDKNW